MAKAKKTSKKAADISALNQTHGALQPQRTVEEMIGYKTAYHTDKLEVYAKEIRELSDEDLRKHAVKFGVIPGINLSRERLHERLEKHFIVQSNKTFYQPQVFFPPVAGVVFRG